MNSNTMKINEASLKDIPELQRLSNEIWKAVYPNIVSMEQIDYMLDKMYSTRALTEQMEQLGHQFLLVELEGQNVGFASYSLKSTEEPERVRLHKLYLQPFLHGKGIGKNLLKEVIVRSLELGGEILELNVNKKNPTYHFYLKAGFKVEKDVVIDIGNNWVMDDYVMILDLMKYSH